MNQAIEKQDKTEIEKKPRTLKDFMLSKKFQQSMKEVLPTYLTADRMARCAIATMVRNPKLAKCTMESVGEAMITLSQLGLEPDGRRAHLIPYGNKCQLIIDYKGLVFLIMGTGLYSRIHAEVVCENDDFEYDCGVVKKHKINFKEDRGQPYAVWCVIVQKDGAEKYEVMTINDVEKIRDRSMSKNNGPWVTDYNEMCKKTVFKRASKWVPWEPKINEALQKDDEQYNIQDVELEEVSTMDRVTKKAAEMANNATG